jgi:predicted nucleic acid-binding protein
MILIDTSVWIEFFRQNSWYTVRIASLLEAREIITIEPVFAELLYGVRQRQDKEMVLSYWQLLPKITFGMNSMLGASEYAKNKNFHSLGIGLFDAIIIKSAMDGNHTIWTPDMKINSNIAGKHIYQFDQ